jgi:hypothetical protein
MKITGNTTLSQLAIRAAQLGIEDIMVHPLKRALGVTNGYRVSVHTASKVCIGHAASMSDAINNAFERIAMAIGASL